MSPDWGEGRSALGGPGLSVLGGAHRTSRYVHVIIKNTMLEGRAGRFLSLYLCKGISLSKGLRCVMYGYWDEWRKSCIHFDGYSMSINIPKRSLVQ